MRRRDHSKLERIYLLKRDLIFAITDARFEQGLTQVELARRLGRSQSFVAKAERLNWNPSLNTLMELADELGLELYVKYQE